MPQWYDNSKFLVRYFLSSLTIRRFISPTEGSLCCTSGRHPEQKVHIGNQTQIPWGVMERHMKSFFFFFPRIWFFLMKKEIKSCVECRQSQEYKEATLAHSFILVLSLSFCLIFLRLGPWFSEINKKLFKTKTRRIKHYMSFLHYV